MKNVINTINEITSTTEQAGITHLYTQNSKYIGNNIILNGNNSVNFGSCSYLGLEFDERLVNGGMDALRNFGTQFSASRTYVSCGLYEKVEERFNKIFDAFCMIAPTTTLGHIATIPTLIEKEDAVILDQQVHASVQNAVQLLKPNGLHVDVIRHSRMDLLEDRIKYLRTRHNKIWYMADGIYSMFGDKAPLDDLYILMDKYPEFNIYIDDSHGMSCYGANGQGYALSDRRIHDKMIVAASLAKAFATGGAVFVFPNHELASKVRRCGGPMLFSGPMQPAALGAAIVSADIHLSPEIMDLQEDLQENIKYTNLLFDKYGLPLVSNNDTSVFYLAAGLPKVGFNLVKRMLDEGVYSNIGVFPAVPIKNTGVRFTITKLHTFEQIDHFAEVMAHHYPLALEEEDSNLNDIRKAFRMKTGEDKHREKMESLIKRTDLSLTHVNTISEINKLEWDVIFEGKGTFDWEGVKILEDTFKGNPDIENNWTFDYFIIRDMKTNKPVLATFTTTTLAKDDMMADAGISEQIEIVRKEQPRYLTSKVVCMGSFLTLGEHLFVDSNSELRKQAIEMLLENITKVQQREVATTVMLRDFSGEDKELDKIVTESGYFKTELLNNHTIVNPVSGNDLKERLSKNARKSFKKNILKYEGVYKTKIVEEASEDQVRHWYELYLNVKNTKSELNTFILPFKLFQQIALSNKWEVIELYLKEGSSNYDSKNAVSVIFNYISGDSYNPMMIGLDYACSEFKPYQQTLYTAIKRAEELGLKNVFLGLTASFEKRKLGAKAVPIYAYMQIEDHYNMEVIQSMSNYKKVKV